MCHLRTCITSEANRLKIQNYLPCPLPPPANLTNVNIWHIRIFTRNYECRRLKLDRICLCELALSRYSYRSISAIFYFRFNFFLLIYSMYYCVKKCIDCFECDAKITKWMIYFLFISFYAVTVLFWMLSFRHCSALIFALHRIVWIWPTIYTNK